MRPYLSPWLFHGPTAFQSALREARGFGKLVCDPIDTNNLKMDQSREIAELMRQHPVGDQPGVIVLGPLDLAPPRSTDVLLKSLEDYDPRSVRPVVWAHDLDGVRPTVRSRCLHQWCPGPEAAVDPEALTAASNLLHAAQEKDWGTVVRLVRTNTVEDLSQALPQTLLSQRHLSQWASLREVLQTPQPSKVEFIRAFLQEAP
jgi:hypothetical protein